MATQRSGEQQQEEEKEKKCEMRLVYHLSRCQSGLETAGRVVVASEEFQMATQPWVERGIQWRERERRDKFHLTRKEPLPASVQSPPQFFPGAKREREGVVVLVGSVLTFFSSSSCT